MTVESIETIDLIMEMIERYGSLRHLGGYKKASFSYTKNKSFEKRYLDLFDDAYSLLDEIESKLIKSLGYIND